jgi:precorrin-3B synthase
MSAPEIKGWCPGALRPMMSGDGLIVRVRPRGGRLSREQAQGIAQLSLRYGNGLIDLSARANVQVRGVGEAGHGQLIKGMSELGLIDPTTEIEARRNIIVTPFWRHGDGTSDLVAGLSDALAALDAPDLPGKFGFAVDTGTEPVLRGVSADIRIQRGRTGLIISADGAVSGAASDWANAAGMAVSLARWFLETGGAVDGRGRMATHLIRDTDLPDVFSAQPIPSLGTAPAFVPGRHALGMLVGFEFGQIRAETLSVLAQIGPLRATPWRMLLIEGAVVLPDIPGLITTPNDPRLRVSACTGAPGCPQAQGQTRTLARALAGSVPVGKHVHVSGCSKGCAHTAASLATLVARPGGLYDLIRDGRASDTPTSTALTPETLATIPELLTEAQDAP